MAENLGGHGNRPPIPLSSLGPLRGFGLTGAISLSRITRSDHSPSDDFLGSAMGFVISKYAVLPARN
jgi:hypothetical protein